MVRERVGDGETVVDGGCRVVVVGERVVDGASVVDEFVVVRERVGDGGTVVVVRERVVEGARVVDEFVVVRERVGDGASVVDEWCRWPVETGVVDGRGVERVVVLRGSVW